MAALPIASPAQAVGEPCTAPPLAPADVRATAEGSNIRFSWTPSPGATSYAALAEYYRPSSLPQVVTESEIAEPTFTVPATDDWWGIQVAIAAGNACGRSERAQLTSAPHLPYPLADLQAFPGRGDIQALWTLDPRNLGYREDMMIRISVEPGGRYCEVSPIVARGCKVTGLAPGRRYTVTATTTNRLGTAVGPALPKPLLVVTGPSAPRGVDVTTARTTATVSWRPPASDGGRSIARYVVTAAPGGRTCTTTGLTCQVTGLSSGTLYRLVVVADNGRAKGAPGLSGDVRTKADPVQSIPVPPPPKPEATIS